MLWAKFLVRIPKQEAAVGNPEHVWYPELYYELLSITWFLRVTYTETKRVKTSKHKFWKKLSLITS